MTCCEPLTCQSVPPFLLDLGLVKPADILSGGLLVQDASRRNMAFRALNGKGGYLVKQVPPDAEPATRDGFDREATAYASIMASTARRHAPALLHHDAHRSLLITQLLRPATSLTNVFLNRGRVEFSDDIEQSLAQTIAEVHANCPAPKRNGAMAVNNIPTGLTLAWNMSIGVGAQQDLSFYRRLNTSIKVHETKAALQTWDQHPMMCHGDLRFENVLLAPDDEDVESARLRIVDWEFASRGDGAWDIACLMADHIRFWTICAVTKEVENPVQAEDKLPFTLEQAARAARVLATAYRQSTHDAVDLDARLRQYLPLAIGAVAYDFHMQTRGQNEQIGKGAEIVCRVLDHLTQRDFAGWLP